MRIRKSLKWCFVRAQNGLVVYVRVIVSCLGYSRMLYCKFIYVEERDNCRAHCLHRRDIKQAKSSMAFLAISD